MGTLKVKKVAGGNRYCSGFAKSHHTRCSSPGCKFKHIQKNCYDDFNMKVAILMKMTLCRGISFSTNLHVYSKQRSLDRSYHVVL